MSEPLNRSGDWRSVLAPLAVSLYALTYALPVSFDLSLLLLATCGILAALYGDSTGGIGPRGIWMPAAAVFGASFLTAAASTDPGRSLTLSAALVPAAALYLLIAGCFGRREWTRWLLGAHLLTGLGLALAVLYLLASSGWSVPAGYENWIAALGSPLLVVSNDLAYLPLLAPFAAALLMSVTGKWLKGLAVVFLLATIAVAGLAQSRQVAGLLLLMLTAMALLLRPRLAAPVGISLTLLLVMLDWVAGFPLAGRIALLWQSGQGGFWDARLPIWGHAWQTFAQHPWLGQGPHTFSYISVDGIQVSWAHNLYLETLAEQGIVGFAALLCLLSALTWRAIAGYRGASDQQRPLAAALVAVMAGILLGGLIEFTFLRLWLNVLLFTTAGLVASVSRESN